MNERELFTLLLLRGNGEYGVPGLVLLRSLTEALPKGITHGQLYTVLRKLRQCGLIDSRPAHGRSHNYFLTEKGVAIVDEFEGRFYDAIEWFLKMDARAKTP